MTKPLRSPLNARKIVGEVYTDEAFDEYAERTHNLHHAFTVTALVLAEMGTLKSGARTKMADQLHVAADIPSYVIANAALAKMGKSGGTVPKDKRKAYVRDTVVFNHALEAMIDSDPSASYKEVLAYLTDSYELLYPNHTLQEKKIAIDNFMASLFGVTNEIVGEQLAGHLGMGVEDANVENDIAGVDRWITVNNKTYGVDFKSSEAAAIEARRKHPDNFIIYTTVPKHILNGKLRLPPEDVARYAPLFKKEVMREIDRHASVVQ